MAFKVSDNRFFIYITDFASIIKSLAYLIELLKIDFSETFVEQTWNFGVSSSIFISYLRSFKHEGTEFIDKQLSSTINFDLIFFVIEGHL